MILQLKLTPHFLACNFNRMLIFLDFNFILITKHPATSPGTLLHLLQDDSAFLIF
jgi:hypothetical protein